MGGLGGVKKKSKRSIESGANTHNGKKPPGRRLVEALQMKPPPNSTKSYPGIGGDNQDETVLNRITHTHTKHLNG